MVSVWSLPCCCIWSLLVIYDSGEYLVITTIAVFDHCLRLVTVVNILVIYLIAVFGHGLRLMIVVNILVIYLIAIFDHCLRLKIVVSIWSCASWLYLVTA